MRPRFQSKNVKVGLFVSLLLVASIIMSLILSGVIALGQSPTPSASPSPSITPSTTANATPSASPAPRLQTESGKVVGVSANMTSFSIQSDNHFQVMVNVDQNTQYFKVNLSQAASGLAMKMLAGMMLPGGQGPSSVIPGMPDMSTLQGMKLDDLIQFSQPAAFGDISAGDFVLIQGMSANNLAQQVFIIHIPKVILGSITALSTNSITIASIGGTAVTLSWDSNTWFILKGVTSAQTGQMAIAAYDSQSNMAMIVLAGVTPLTPLPSRAPNLTPAATPSSTTSPSATSSGTPSISPSTSATPAQISLDASTSLGKIINLSVGATLAITLPSNPSTGFSWELVQISDNTVLQKVSNQLNPAASPVPGAPGTETWTFQALKAGTTGLFMQYSQPFTGGTKGAQTLALTIIVQ